MEQWAGVVLAAGEGVRMKSRLPKVLHRVCGKELIRYPVDLMRQLGIRRVMVVVSPTNCKAIQNLLGDQVEYATQPQVLGTGDAVNRVTGHLADRAEHLLVLSGDVPLLGLDSTRQMMDRHVKAACDMTILTATGVETLDLGRVLRDEQGRVVDIVEAGDWKGPTDGPAEVNGGVYCFSVAWLKDNLGRIEPSPQGEKYLTSLAGIGAARGAKVQGVNCTPNRRLDDFPLTWMPPLFLEGSAKAREAKTSRNAQKINNGGKLLSLSNTVALQAPRRKTETRYGRRLSRFLASCL